MMQSSNIQEESAALRDDIDLGALATFYAHDVSLVTPKELTALGQVITMVLHIHYGRFVNQWDDLRSEALVVLLERHDRYNSSYSAYPYVYTMVRNTVGNLLRKLVREGSLELIDRDKASYTLGYPEDLEELLPYLCGGIGFEEIEVSNKVVSSLLQFCEQGCSSGRLDSIGAMNKVVERLIYILTHSNNNIKD